MTQKPDNGNHAATPGPWRIGYDDGSGSPPKDWPPYTIQSVATGEMIVDATSGENEDMKSWELGVLTAEDARLIAAAPELLTQLQQFVDIVEIAKREEWRNAAGELACREPWISLAKEAGAAIAKAKGD